MLPNRNPTNRSFSPFLGQAPNYKDEEDADPDKSDEESDEGSLSENTESGSDFQVSNNEASESGESDEDGGQEEEIGGSDDVPHEEEKNYGQVDDSRMLTERVKTENTLPDEDVHTFDLAEIMQRGIKRERDLDDPTEDKQPAPSREVKSSKFTTIQTETTEFDCYDFNELIRNNQRRVKDESRSDGHF